MFENPRRGRQARNFTTNVPKIVDLKSSSELKLKPAINFTFILHLLSVCEITSKNVIAFSLSLGNQKGLTGTTVYLAITYMNDENKFVSVCADALHE